MHYRQGDVLIIKIKNAEKKGLKKVDPDSRGRLVLAEGEATGHAHALPASDASLWEIPGSLDKLLEVHIPTKIEHEEHGHIDVLADQYYVRRQTEYKFGTRTIVAD